MLLLLKLSTYAWRNKSEVFRSVPKYRGATTWGSIGKGSVMAVSSDIIYPDVLTVNTCPFKSGFKLVPQL